MNFGSISHRLKKYERAKAKLNEFSVSQVERNENKLIKTSSSELLYSTIRVLSQYSTCYIEEQDVTEIYNDLTFVAQFYESYVEGEDIKDDPFFFLTGAIANILSDNFGNAKSLITKINRKSNFNNIASLVLKYISQGVGVNNENINLDQDLNNEFYNPLIEEVRTNSESLLMPKLKKFADDMLKTNDSESAFFSLMLCAIHKKFLENSAVRNIPQWTNSSISDWNKYFNQRGAIRILWQAQKLLLENEILKGKNATIQLPTGVGKTRSIELIISAAFLLRGVSLAVVIAPLRALCNEIEKDLNNSLKGIVEITAISDIFNDEELDFTRRQVLVLTPEKLSYLMRHNSDIIQKCGLIIFDEAHMFDDPARGASYELLVMHIKKQLSPESQRIFISAVMPNVNELNEWLTGDGVIVTDKNIKKTEKSIGFFSQKSNRIYFYQQADLINQRDEMIFIPQVCPKVPFVLSHYKRKTKNNNVGDIKDIFPEKAKASDIALYLACKICNTKNIAAIYVNQPKSIFKIANEIMELHDLDYGLLDNISEFSNYSGNIKIHELAKQHFGDDIDFVNMMRYGFFPHFGDLENGLRVSIEHEIRQQKIGCVICTSTLAEGVNLPIKYLFMTSLKDAFGQQLTTRKFQNLIGRTARSGIHTEGSLICTESKYFDEKMSNAKQWYQIVKLFDASKSEHCNSAILQIFDNLKIPYLDKELKGTCIINKYLEKYDSGTQIEVNSLAKSIYEEFIYKNIAIDKHKKYNKIIVDVISKHISQIGYIVTALEAAIFEEEIEKLNGKDEIKNISVNFSLAERTLAFKMATDELRQSIVQLFNSIILKIEMISKDKKAIFAKTMNGIDNLNKVDTYLQLHAEFYEQCVFNEDQIIKIVIDLSNIFLANNSKFLLLEEEKKRQLLQAWTQGKTYKQIAEISGLDIKKLIKICQQDMGYSFNVLLASLYELLTQYKPVDKSDTEWDSFMEKLTLFQQRMKYGLLNAAEIAAYEYGYADRIIARKIGAILQKKYANKTVELYKNVIKDSKDDIIKLLENYPNYFIEVVKI